MQWNKNIKKDHVCETKFALDLTIRKLISFNVFDLFRWINSQKRVIVNIANNKHFIKEKFLVLQEAKCLKFQIYPTLHKFLGLSFYVNFRDLDKTSNFRKQRWCMSWGTLYDPHSVRIVSCLCHFKFFILNYFWYLPVYLN